MITPTRFLSFDAAYKFLVAEILEHGQLVRPRGMLCREIETAVFTAPAENARLDFTTTAVPERQEVWVRYLEREHAWYLSGDDSAASAPASFWNTIADANGRVNSNYGKMILHDRKYPGGLTAFESVVKALKADPESRQALMHYGDPRYHTDGNRDVPCTVVSHAMIRRGALHLVVHQRSCDIIRGLSYDFCWHAYLVERLAKELSVSPGNVTHLSDSLHIYEKHFDLARRITTKSTP